MPSILTTHAIERSTYAVTIAFTDTNGEAVVPSAVSWTLTDTMGNVVNSRTAVSVTPAASVTIVLSGDDLALTSALYGRQRVLLIEATYSGTLGAGLAWKDEVNFIIDDLVKVV